MALSAAALSSAMKTQLDAAFGAPAHAGGAADRQALCDAIAEAVVEHLIANAIVNVTSVSGVTPGGGVSGPGTGTIT